MSSPTTVAEWLRHYGFSEQRGTILIQPKDDPALAHFVSIVHPSLNAKLGFVGGVSACPRFLAHDPERCAVFFAVRNLDGSHTVARLFYCDIESIYAGKNGRRIPFPRDAR